MDNLAVMQQIMDKIKSYDKIVISRHKRPDGDAIGSTKGLASILKQTFPKKDIRVISEDSSDYLAFLGQDDEQQPDEFYSDALVIVIDTATEDRASNSKIGLAKEVIKIDHHFDIKPYGDLCWIEDWRSSASEMIAYFYQTFSDELVLDKQGALYIYTGMVTDSGRFRYESTNGDTMRLAGMLLDMGIDSQTLFAHLYLEDFDHYKFQAYLYKKMQLTTNGVAYLIVDKRMQRKFNLTLEQASEAVSAMNSIKGSIAWLAFIETPDGNIRVRLRSRFMTINALAEKYNGGGHACTCGATLTNKKQIKDMLLDADKLVADYKANNTDWL